jgi:hypothetical protein
VCPFRTYKENFRLTFMPKEAAMSKHSITSTVLTLVVGLVVGGTALPMQAAVTTNTRFPSPWWWISPARGSSWC